MPWIPIAIGAGVGLLEAQQQKKTQIAQTEKQATTDRWSQWTGQKGQTPAAANELQTVAAGAGAGAELGQNMQAAGMMSKGYSPYTGLGPGNQAANPMGSDSSVSLDGTTMAGKNNTDYKATSGKNLGASDMAGMPSTSPQAASAMSPYNSIMGSPGTPQNNNSQLATMMKGAGVDPNQYMAQNQQGQYPTSGFGSQGNPVPKGYLGMLPNSPYYSTG